MENKFDEYFIKKGGEHWHTYKIGEYHVTAVGCSHQDKEPEEHYGPCLRVTWQNYKNKEIERGLQKGNLREGYKETMSESGEGNTTMGKILHEKAEEIRKHNNPSVNTEFAIVLKEVKLPKEHFTDEELKRGLNEVKIKTSLDLMEQDPEQFINDLKTASDFTFPRSEYDYSITYEDQVDLCTYIATNFVFRKSYFNPEKKSITYIKKANLTTNEIPISYNKEKAKKKWEDFLERVRYLHICILRNNMPSAEPHKWCKYCPLLKEICIPNGDIVEVKEGRKKRYLKNVE